MGRITLAGLIGGTAGGAVGAIVIHAIVMYVGVPLQKVNDHSILIVFWGILLGLGVTAGISVFHQKKKMHSFLKAICGILGASATGAFGGELISGTFYGGSVFGGILGFWIMLGISVSKVFVGKKNIIKDVIYFTIGGVVAGGGAGITSGLLWGFLAKGAHAEGYVLLVIAMLSVLGIIWGIGILLGLYIVNNNFSTRTKRLTIGVVVFLFIIAGIQTIGVQSTKPIDDSNIKTAETHFTLSPVLPNNAESEIIEIIKRKKDLGLSELTALYILTDDKQYAFKVKDILLKEAREKIFTTPAHSVKGEQFKAVKRVICYLEVKDLFNQEEKEEIVDWFKDIVKRIFTVEWVDYLYALAFKREPTGPYENQEIGVGALAVFAPIIEEKYPEIAQECREYIDKYAVVWGGNFRNTDDKIGYQSWWIYSAFLVAKYRPMPEWLTNRNAREAFEWILKQWPPSGMTVGYNNHHPANIADTMALGASLFSDGRYKWLALRMLQQLSVEEDILLDDYAPFYFGLVSWDDSLELVKPSVGSTYLMGPGEFPHDPGPLMPDKIVFREGWEDSSFYALLNLRYSGWHKYKASNCFVNIIYGKPFVVEDLISKRNTWLPAGRSWYRDKKIDRIRLNGFQVGLEGYELLVYDLLKIGSPWAQDPPQYADVEDFHQTATIDFAKTTISQWRGWMNERVSLLVKDNYFIVFDSIKRDKNGRVAVSWHLKGDHKINPESIELEQGGYRMNIYYPHDQNWYQIEIRDSSEKDPPAGYIHDPDIDLYMISDKKSKAGFITLFASQRFENPHIVEAIDVKNSENRSIYPDALGIEVKNEGRKDIIGVAFVRNSFTYDSVKTDTELFVLREEPNNWCITYKNGSFLEVISPEKPSELTIDTQILKENVDWSYSDSILKIKFPKGIGEVRVKYL